MLDEPRRWGSMLAPGDVPDPRRGFSSADLHPESARRTLMRTEAKANYPAPPGAICCCAPFAVIDRQDCVSCLPPGGGRSQHRCLRSRERARDITTEIRMSAIGNTPPAIAPP